MRAVLTIDRDGYRFAPWGCEPLTGPYDRDGSHLSFTVDRVGRMGCARAREDEYMRDLSRVTSFVVDDDTLSLLDANGRVLLRLVELEASDRPG